MNVRVRLRVLARGGGEPWKEEAVCRQQVRNYMAAGWSYERAQRYIFDLYYAPGDGKKPGREPAAGRVAEDDGFYLARGWCRSCPVQSQCLEEAVAAGDVHGFRAGFTPNELARVMKRRRREQRLEAAGAQPLIVSSGRR